MFKVFSYIQVYIVLSAEESNTTSGPPVKKQEVKLLFLSLAVSLTPLHRNRKPCANCSESIKKPLRSFTRKFIFSVKIKLKRLYVMKIKMIELEAFMFTTSQTTA